MSRSEARFLARMLYTLSGLCIYRVHESDKEQTSDHKKYQSAAGARNEQQDQS